MCIRDRYAGQGGLLHLHTAGHFDLEIGFGQSHAFIPAKIAAVEAEIIVIRIFPAAAGKSAVVFRPSSIHFTDIPGRLVGRQVAMDLSLIHIYLSFSLLSKKEEHRVTNLHSMSLLFSGRFATAPCCVQLRL